MNHSGVAVHLDAGVRTALGVAVNCLETLTADWNRYRLDEEGVNRRTIFVDTTGVAATDFGLNAATRQRLFANGQAADPEVPRQSPDLNRLWLSGLADWHHGETIVEAPSERRPMVQLTPDPVIGPTLVKNWMAAAAG